MIAGSELTLTYDAWSAALLEVLLPRLSAERWGQVALLCCDDEAVHAAANGLGSAANEPAAEFGRLVEARFHIGHDGSPDRIRRDTVRFRTGEHDRDEVPPFFGACCAFVLAASRMTSDGALHTGNYYDRLWEVLGNRPTHSSPYDFGYMPYLFQYLEEWLRTDIDGERGHLYVQRSGPQHVGYAINQCVFRERDKERLAEFFADRVGRGREALDLVRLLQVSSDRHRLTQRARQAIAAPELQELARAALTHAFETWDGTRPDPRGGRSWLASLHLSVNRNVRLTISAPEAPEGLALDEERVLEHPERDRVPLLASELCELVTHGIRWGSTEASGIYLPRSGETLVFEVREDSGLVWVSAPEAEHVFVLTCDRDMQSRLRSHLVDINAPSVLPEGWRLHARVPVAELPTGLAGSVASRPPVALVAGLRIGTNRYLAGCGPRLEIGDVDERISVWVDDLEYAVLDAGGNVQLDLPVGEHHLDVGSGLVHWTLHFLERNPARPAYGQLVYPFSDRGSRAGASTRSSIEGPTVCGALLSEAYSGDIPLMLRTTNVVIVAADGTSESRDAPDPPGWLAHIGLAGSGTRWEVEIPPEALWALTATQAIAIRPAVPVAPDAEARAAIERIGRRPRPRVRSLHRADREAAFQAFAQILAQLDAAPS
ncbi:MAG TPA: hypothetical protein VN892_15130 [Solirubrobacteraceae bacterium]|nr:hypothetical protein [Solirubrobacteraceae bacterium]